MPGLGFSNATNITIERITAIANVSSPMDFFVNVNQDIYNGWLYFLLLIVLWIILFVAGTQGSYTGNRPAVNALYASMAVTLVSFFLRALSVVQNGVVRGLLDDTQMWVFPLLTIVLAVWIKSTKED